LPSSANDPRLRRTPSAGDKRLRTPSSTSPDRLTKRSRPSYQSVDVIDLTIGHTSLNGVIDLSLDSDDDMSDIIEVCAPPVSEIVHRPRPRPPKPADLIKAPRTAQKELPTTGTPKTAVIQANDKSASSLPKPVPILDRVEGRISDVCLDSVVHGTPHDEFTTQSRPVVPILGGFQHDSISSKPNRASFDHTVETTAPSILGAAGDNGSFDIPATVSAVRPALSYPSRSPSLTPALPAVKQSPPSTNHRRGIFSFDARSRPEVAGMKRTVLRLIETIYPQPSLDIERNRSVVTPSWVSRFIVDRLA